MKIVQELELIILLLALMANLPAQLLEKKIQTFQSHQDSQEAVKEEGLTFPIYVALLSLGLLYLSPFPSIWQQKHEQIPH